MEPFLLVTSIMMLTFMVLMLFSFVVCLFTENMEIKIYTQPGDNGGWHCVEIDWFWLRGFLTVVCFYFKRWLTLGKFKFTWESD